MPLVILTGLIFLLAWWPALWVRHVMRRHGVERDDIPGTGGELVTHLLQRFEIDAEVEEAAPRNNHYDPIDKKVRLEPALYSGKSLTAVAVAAHEVGHAIQFDREEAVSRLRMKYMPLAARMKVLGVWLLYLMPVVGVITRAPAAAVALVAISLLLQLLGALMYLIVLPEEWDASFAKALPILVDGEYVSEDDLPAVRQVLKAAALTYFASAVAEILSLGRLLIIFRR